MIPSSFSITVYSPNQGTLHIIQPDGSLKQSIFTYEDADIQPDEKPHFLSASSRNLLWDVFTRKVRDIAGPQSKYILRHTIDSLGESVFLIQVERDGEIKEARLPTLHMVGLWNQAAAGRRAVEEYIETSVQPLINV